MIAAGVHHVSCAVSDLARTRRIHDRLLPLFRANFQGAPNPVPAKAAMVAMGLLDVDVHWIPWDEHYHLDLRFLAVASGTLAPDATEVRAAEWLAWDEAFVRIAEPALRRALGKARVAVG